MRKTQLLHKRPMRVENIWKTRMWKGGYITTFIYSSNSLAQARHACGARTVEPFSACMQLPGLPTPDSCPEFLGTWFLQSPSSHLGMDRRRDHHPHPNGVASNATILAKETDLVENWDPQRKGQKRRTGPAVRMWAGVRAHDFPANRGLYFWSPPGDGKRKTERRIPSGATGLAPAEGPSTTTSP